MYFYAVFHGRWRSWWKGLQISPASRLTRIGPELQNAHCNNRVIHSWKNAVNLGQMDGILTCLFDTGWQADISHFANSVYLTWQTKGTPEPLWPTISRVYFITWRNRRTISRIFWYLPSDSGPIWCDFSPINAGKAVGVDGKQTPSDLGQ